FVIKCSLTIAHHVHCRSRTATVDRDDRGVASTPRKATTSTAAILLTRAVRRRPGPTGLSVNRSKEIRQPKLPDEGPGRDACTAEHEKLTATVVSVHRRRGI